jgi:hypothetical protein
MKKALTSKTFAITFFLTYAGFIFVTMILFDFSSPGVGIGVTAYGFPFSYAYSHHYGYQILWPGFLANLFTAAVFSLVSGLIVSTAVRKVSSPEFRQKWYLG